MESFNLEYYRAFYTVAQTGNVTKAAEAAVPVPARRNPLHPPAGGVSGCSCLPAFRGVRLTVEGTALFPMWTALSNLRPTANAS